MRAVYYDRTGPATDVLRLGNLPDPVVGPGDVLVRVAASGINPADVKRRAGWGGMAMGHARIIPHCDGAGVIEGAGAGVDRAQIGQRVWLWNAQGGYGTAGRADGTAAELIALPHRQAVPLPDHYSMAEGACLGVPAMTAHRCVMADGPVANETVLVQGGAGAVGYLAVQIAIAEGAQVIATVSGQDKAARISALGGQSIDRTTEDVPERVLDLTNGEGVDRIVEVDFAANQTANARMLKTNGTIASYSSSSDPQPVLDYYVFAAKGANLRLVQGFALPLPARACAIDWVGANHLDIPIAATFPLERCAEAHERVEQSVGFGQIVILNAPERA
ncbi:MAG: NADPH:quinone reductase [Pseudomonadota bacterium]